MKHNVYRNPIWAGVAVLVIALVACTSPEDPSKQFQSNIPAPEPAQKTGKTPPVPPSLKEAMNRPDANDFGPQPSPKRVLQKYAIILSKRIKTPTLGLYSPDTQRFLSSWKVTDRQQRNELNDLLKVLPFQEIKQTLDRAVIRFPVKFRHAAPYFIFRSSKGWVLDLVAMNKNIGFNQNNQWFLRNQDHQYMFGFDDWRFDTNGFPAGNK